MSFRQVILFISILFGLYVVTISLLNISDRVSSASAEEIKEKKILYWTCGMHLSVKMDKPGKCPICAMDLVPVYEKGARAVEAGGPVNPQLYI